LSGTFWTGLAQGQTPAPEISRVRLLLVVDTMGDGADINAFALDLVNMKKVLKESLREQNLEHCYTLDILQGADATPTKVLEYYRDLKTDASEALVCYYSGHGGTDKTQGHFLEMKAGRLFRTDLRAAMLASNPRLVVLLTDCCANYAGVFPSLAT